MGCFLSKCQTPTLTGFRGTNTYRPVNGPEHSSTNVEKISLGRDEKTDEKLCVNGARDCRTGSSGLHVTHFPPAPPPSPSAPVTPYMTSHNAMSDEGCHPLRIQYAEDLEPVTPFPRQPTPVVDEIDGCSSTPVTQPVNRERGLKKTTCSRNLELSVEELDNEDLSNYGKLSRSTIEMITTSTKEKTPLLPRRKERNSDGSPSKTQQHPPGVSSSDPVSRDLSKAQARRLVTYDASLEGETPSVFLTETKDDLSRKQVNVTDDKLDKDGESACGTKGVEPANVGLANTETKSLSNRNRGQEPCGQSDRPERLLSAEKPAVLTITMHERDLKVSRKRKRPERTGNAGKGATSADKHFDGFLRSNVNTKLRSRPGSGTSTWTLDSTQTLDTSLTVDSLKMNNATDGESVGHGRSGRFNAEQRARGSTDTLKSFRLDGEAVTGSEGHNQYSYLTCTTTPISYNSALTDEATEIVDMEDDTGEDDSWKQSGQTKVNNFDAWLGIKPYNVISSSHQKDSDSSVNSRQMFAIGPSTSELNTKQKLLYAKYARRPKSESILDGRGKPPLPPAADLRKRPASDTMRKSQGFSRYLASDVDMHC